MRTSWLAVSAAFAFQSACLSYGARDAGPDGGEPVLDVDAGRADAGANPRDAGLINDAGANDAGANDAGPNDAGPRIDAGPIDAGPVDAGPVPAPNMNYFISSEGAAFGGRFAPGDDFDNDQLDDGIDAADALCQRLAEVAYRGEPDQVARTWRAYLSVSKIYVANGNFEGSVVNARDRIGAGPFIDFNGQTFANDLTALHLGGVPSTSALTEQGELMDGSALIWTGSNSSGRVGECNDNFLLPDGGCPEQPNAAPTCARWTDPGQFGQFGNVGVAGGGTDWNSVALRPCENAPGGSQGHRDGDGQIYCFALN